MNLECNMMHMNACYNNPNNNDDCKFKIDQLETTLWNNWGIVFIHLWTPTLH